MSEIPPLLSDPADPPRVVKRRSPRGQLGLQRLILLIAVIAVWMTVYLNRRQEGLLEDRIKAMVPLAHELIVDDPTQVAIVRLEAYWMDDDRWDIFLPPGSYRLCIATHDVAKGGLASVLESVPIRSGRHRLALLQDRDEETYHIRVTRDADELLSVQEPKTWHPGTGSEGGGEFSLNAQRPPDKPIVLYRRRFKQPTGTSPGSSRIPTGPTEGILLWIERVGGSKPGP